MEERSRKTNRKQRAESAKTGQNATRREWRLAPTGSWLCVVGSEKGVDDAGTKLFGGRATGALDGASKRTSRVIAQVEGEFLDRPRGVGSEDGCNELDEDFLTKVPEGLSGFADDGPLYCASADAQLAREIF